MGQPLAWCLSSHNSVGLSAWFCAERKLRKGQQKVICNSACEFVRAGCWGSAQRGGKECRFFKHTVLNLQDMFRMTPSTLPFMSLLNFFLFFFFRFEPFSFVDFPLRLGMFCELSSVKYHVFLVFQQYSSVAAGPSYLNRSVNTTYPRRVRPWRLLRPEVCK